MDESRLELARSWHLGPSPETRVMAATSIALIRTMEAFQREALSMFRLVSDADISFNEVVVLHVVAMHDRPKDAASIARILDRSDVSNVLYNLRKLSSLGLVEKAKDGAATIFRVTESGRELALRYAAVRRRVLLDTWKGQPRALEGLVEVTFTLRHMTGVYDAQTRELASLDPGQFPSSDAAEPADRGARRRQRR